MSTGSIASDGTYVGRCGFRRHTIQSIPMGRILFNFLSTRKWPVFSDIGISRLQTALSGLIEHGMQEQAGSVTFDYNTLMSLYGVTLSNRRDPLMTRHGVVYRNFLLHRIGYVLPSGLRAGRLDHGAWRYYC